LWRLCPSPCCYVQHSTVHIICYCHHPGTCYTPTSITCATANTISSSSTSCIIRRYSCCCCRTWWNGWGIWSLYCC
jgi:hypothetical protein